VEPRLIVYDQRHWDTLASIRADALRLMEPLTRRHISCLVYGSVARGDVSETSDVDVFVPDPPAPALIESALERGGLQPTNRELVQATPGYAAKAYVYFGDLRSVSFPLVDLLPSEREFYGFAGSASQEQLKSGARVPGVDKRLTLIEPTPTGHRESPASGREGEVARLLGVDTRVVVERVRTLERRERVGRTGVYLKRSLGPDEGFGEVLEELSLRRPGLRRRIRG
jgi:predicted nucleotidyltransferase